MSGSFCAVCRVEVSLPSDARPDREIRLCPKCFRDRWEREGKPSDPLTGEIAMFDGLNRVRWSNVAGDEVFVGRG